MTVCAYGRAYLGLGPVQCKERPVAGRMYCRTHHEQAMARVAQVPTARRGDKPRRWSGGYFVSGSSKE